MSTVNLTEDNFATVLKDNDTVLVDFWATWCAPCRQFAPIFESSSDDHPEIVHAKLDTELAPAIASAAAITAIPTLMAFREGIPVFRQSGALPAKSLAELIDNVKSLDMDDVRRQIAEQKSAEKQDG